MLSDQLKIIQDLVNSASILTRPEKNEWMELMDLMSDKQLLQLERILKDADQSRILGAAADINADKGSSVKPGVVLPGIKPAAANQYVVKPAPSVPSPKAAAPGEAGQKPPFSHILNFPKGGIPANSDHNLLKDVKKPESAFSKKLKAIFAEKELPPGHLEELSAPKAAVKFPEKQTEAKKIPPKVPAVPKIIKHELPAQKPKEEIKAEKTQDDKVKNSVLEALKQQTKKSDNVTINVYVNDEKTKESVPGLEQAQQVMQQNRQQENQAPVQQAQVQQPTQQSYAQPANLQSIVFASPNNITGESVKVVENPGMKSAAAVRSQGASVTLGMNFPELRVTSPVGEAGSAGADASAGGQVQLQQTQEEFVKPAFKAEIQEKPGDDMKLQSLEDLKNLKPEDLQAHATGTFLKKIQKLISQYGFYQVTFNLESSPLYKAYVQTGVQWLKNGVQPGNGAGQFSQKDFEHFTDLLIVMRTKV